MLEIEIKAALKKITKDTVIDALHAAGFEEGRLKRESDLYFNGNDRDFRQTDEALRIRSSRSLKPSGPTICSLTYKGKKTDGRSQTRQEWETRISHQGTIKEILLHLGYRPVFTVSKERYYFHRGPITACLDQVEGLGHFSELEQVANLDASDPDAAAQKECVIDSLLNILEELGVPKENLLQESYLEMLMKKKPGSGPE